MKKLPLPGRPAPLKPLASAETVVPQGQLLPAKEAVRRSGVHIRLATTTDLPAVQFCARAAYAQYLDRMDREPAPMVADFANLIQRRYVHVALISGAVVGYVVFYLNDKSMQLDNVAVNPEFAGQGIGKQLISFVESTASKQGLIAVELFTNVAMTENQVLYPKLGYAETTRKQQDGFSRVFYRKRLNT